MTVIPGAPSGRDGAPGLAGSATHLEDDVPVRAEAVQLIGEMRGSGYREPPALVRRSDGQTIQLTPLLYLVLDAVDGRRNHDEIASKVSERFGRLVSADDVRTLVDSQLLPLGVLQLADGSQPEVKKSNPLLALRFRYAVTDPEKTRKLTAPFARLFNPFLVFAVLAAFVAACWWVLFEKGLASATREAFDNPGLLLLIFVVSVFSAGFHEFGHAAAARYGGSTPGVMGMGVYLVWPAFYTDVTDSYRLGRGGRVRTDLGGLYFNALVAVGIVGAWWFTRYDALLLVVATQILQMVRQLLPLVRFDGYYVLADLTGVPDLFQRIKPTLLGVLPWNWGKPETKLLKPWARAVVRFWVLTVVPLLLFCVVMMVLALPRVLGTAWASVQEQQAMLSSSFGAGDILDVSARILSMIAIAFPVLGIAYILTRLVRQITSAVRRRTEGKPFQRGVAAVTAAAIVAGLAWAWWPDDGTYRPIQRYERGTITDAVTQAVAFARPAPVGLQEGRPGQMRTVWPAGIELPTADEPQLAMVLVPRGAQDGDVSATADAGSATDTAGGSAPVTDPARAPSWVFPFNEPLPPAEGDNQSLAVNTQDGSVVYDIAFALVWVEDEHPVLNTNEAYAFASCTDCAAVAVGFQVVLVVGQADVVVPQNLSAAVNYNCIRCLTYALATQLVVTLDGPLSDAGMTELSRLWAEIAAFAEQIQDLPLSALRARLTSYEARILEIIEDNPGTTATPADPGTDPDGDTSGTSPTPADGTSPDAGPSTDPGTDPDASTDLPEPESSAEPTPTPDAEEPAEPTPSEGPSATSTPQAAETSGASGSG